MSILYWSQFVFKYVFKNLRYYVISPRMVLPMKNFAKNVKYFGNGKTQQKKREVVRHWLQYGGRWGKIDNRDRESDINREGVYIE